MGAIAVWVIKHAQRIAAWAMILAALGALAYGIHESAAYRTLAAGTQNIGQFLYRALDMLNTSVSGMNTAMNTALSDGNGSPWVRLICYCAYLDGWGELTTLVAANFEGLVATTFAAFVLVWRIALLVFAYTKTRQIAQAIGQLQVR